jgi:hypothetical protein
LARRADAKRGERFLDVVNDVDTLGTWQRRVDIVRCRSAQHDLEAERQRLQITDQVFQLVLAVEVADAEPHRFGPQTPDAVNDQPHGRIEQQRHLPIGLPKPLRRQHKPEVVRLTGQGGKDRVAQSGLADHRHMALRMFVVEPEISDTPIDTSMKEASSFSHISPSRRAAALSRPSATVAYPARRCVAAFNIRSAPILLPDLRTSQKLSTKASDTSASPIRSAMRSSVWRARSRIASEARSGGARPVRHPAVGVPFQNHPFGALRSRGVAGLRLGRVAGAYNSGLHHIEVVPVNQCAR